MDVWYGFGGNIGKGIGSRNRIRMVNSGMIKVGGV